MACSDDDGSQWSLPDWPARWWASASTIIPAVGRRTHPAPASIEAQQLSGAATVGAGFVAPVADVRRSGRGAVGRAIPAARFAIQTRGTRRPLAHGHRGRRSSDGPPPGSGHRSKPPARSHAVAATEPVWVGRARAVRVRWSQGTARATSWCRPDRSPRAATGAANVAGAATVAMPGIISRPEWGADENLRLANCPEPPDISTNAKIAVVHHTGGNNNYGPGDTPAIVRGLYGYATQTLQYCDTHYNFFVDRYGQIFEGRFGSVWDPVRAAHATGMNTGSVGVAVIGNFQTTGVPAAADRRARTLAGVEAELARRRPDPAGRLHDDQRHRPMAGRVDPHAAVHRRPSGSGPDRLPGRPLYALLPIDSASTSRVRIVGGGADAVSGHAHRRSSAEGRR